MIEQNRAEFEKCNVLEYHQAGILGQGWLAAVLDDGCPPKEWMTYVSTPLGVIVSGNHASQVCRVYHEWAPEAKVVSLPYTGQPLAVKLASIAWIEANRPNVVICSFHEGAGDHIRRLIATGIPMFCASGNQGYEDRVNYPARYAETIAVGALEDYRNLVAGYSNEGPELNCIAHTNIMIPKIAKPVSDDDSFYFNGTSASAPSAAGEYTIYCQAHDMYPNQELSQLIVKSSCVDYYNEGFDWKSGWGLFVLPKWKEPIMRDIDLLHPELQPKCRKLIELAKAKGINLLITQTLRTREEQDALYAQGRTSPGPVVTNLLYPESHHCWGLAFDVAILVLGRAVYPIDQLAIVGALGESLGLEWGGRWSSFVDRPHFQLPGYSISRLLTQYGEPSKFIVTWKEDEDMPGFEGPANVEMAGKAIPAGILSGRTYVELRTLATMLNLEIGWDPVTKTVTLK